MASILAKSLDRPDESRTPSDRGRIDIVNLEGATVGRATFQPGWRWSQDVKPVAGTELCEVTHTGYVVSGREGVRMADGTELELGPGDAFVIGPGHDAWVIGDEPCVTLDFSGTAGAVGAPAAKGFTSKRIDEMQAIFHGAFKLAAAELGVASFGMQVFDVPSGFSDYPEHDHGEDGQEEVYIVLRGTVDLEVDGRRSTLDAERMARVGPGTKRKLHGGAEGARVLIIGGVPGGIYSRPADFQLGAPDPNAHATV